MMVLRLFLEMMGLIFIFGILLGLGMTAAAVIQDYRFRRKR